MGESSLKKKLAKLLEIPGPSVSKTLAAVSLNTQTEHFSNSLVP